MGLLFGSELVDVNWRIRPGAGVEELAKLTFNVRHQPCAGSLRRRLHANVR